MKKIKLFSLLGLGFISVFGILLGVAHNNFPTMLCAEPEETSEPVDNPVDEPTEDPVDNPADETFECKVVFSGVNHGKIEADKMEGHIGDIVTITVNPDLFYITQYVEANGSNLVEDEEISGLYKFALVEGENKITAHFVIDEALLGKLSTMVEQASNKDWTNLFSVRNVIALLAFVLDGGILIAIVRYFVKDKKLADKVEKKVEKTVKDVLPDTTKEIVLKTVEDLIAPYFVKIEVGFNDIQEMLVVFCRCFALMQENTPESRIAITRELSSLKLSDKASIKMIEDKINDFVAETRNQMVEVLTKLNDMNAENKEIIQDSEEPEEPVEESQGDNGTQI